jgi:hypothetical protein
VDPPRQTKKMAPTPPALPPWLPSPAIGTHHASHFDDKTPPAQEGWNSPGGHAQPALILLVSSSLFVIVSIRPIPSNPAMVMSSRPYPFQPWCHRPHLWHTCLLRHHSMILQIEDHSDGWMWQQQIFLGDDTHKEWCNGGWIQRIVSLFRMKKLYSFIVEFFIEI